MTDLNAERDAPSDAVLESLYKLNKHAKKYAELASENYEKGKKGNARANSCKKEALYAVKSEVLSELNKRADRVERHEINGSEFFCLYFGDWAFHTPVEDITIPDERVAETVELDDFEKSSEPEHTSQSLKESLLHIESEFGLNANEFLPQQFVSYGANSYFIGWKYLGED